VLLIKKWFTEIVLVYLPEGHTHEKVGRMLKDFHTFCFTINQECDPIFMYKNSILERTWIGFQGSLMDG
jgi:hypothetical protein